MFQPIILTSHMTITIKDETLKQAASQGVDSFLSVIVSAFQTQVGKELDGKALSQLNASQITLWGYLTLRDELMDGGFVQLIYNGYGPFFFDNPFAKAMRLWGLHDFSKLLYKAKKVYDEHKAELTKECTDEEFMALFEQYPEFDDLDDEFVEEEESITMGVGHYVDEHISDFIAIEK